MFHSAPLSAQERPMWGFTGSFSAARRNADLATANLHMSRRKALVGHFTEWYNRFDYECYMMENMIREAHPTMGENNVYALMYETWLCTPSLSAGVVLEVQSARETSDMYSWTDAVGTDISWTDVAGTDVADVVGEMVVSGHQDLDEDDSTNRVLACPKFFW